jgi:hypothetical protein
LYEVLGEHPATELDQDEGAPFRMLDNGPVSFTTEMLDAGWLQERPVALANIWNARALADELEEHSFDVLAGAWISRQRTSLPSWPHRAVPNPCLAGSGSLARIPPSRG